MSERASGCLLKPQTPSLKQIHQIYGSSSTFEAKKYLLLGTISMAGITKRF